MTIALRHGLGWHAEDRRFVHVVPDAVDTLPEQALVQRSPPRPYRLAREVWERARARPHLALILSSISGLDEAALLSPLVVDPVGMINLDPWVDHAHELEPVSVELIGQAARVGEL